MTEIEPIKKIVPKIVPVLKQNEPFTELRPIDKSLHDLNRDNDSHLFPSLNDDKQDGIKKIKSHLSKSNQPEIDYTVKISIPSLSDLHREIYTQIQSNVYNIVGETLASISKDTGMSLEKLQETYLSPLKIIMDTNMEQLEKTTTTVKKTKKSLDITELCLARTSAGVQCSRKRQVNMEFCGSHLTTQPYGRIDQQPEDKMLRKRGRPSTKGSQGDPPKTGGADKGTAKPNKDAIQNQPTDTNDEQDQTVDKDEIIQVKFEIKEINDMTYIVDENGNIYEPPPPGEEGVLDIEDLVQVGQELNDGTYLWLN